MKLLFSIIELILEENTILTLIRIKSFQIQIYPIRLLTTKTFLQERYDALKFQTYLTKKEI